MNLLYPGIKLHQLPRMLAVSALGAAVAGACGILHDQITYTLSQEYFTRLKFDPFSCLDLRDHPRLFAGVIGFLATWWVGLFAGWFLARVIVPSSSSAKPTSLLCKSFALM